MNKILYITASSKPEERSASRTVSRALVNRLLKRYPDFAVEELNLFEEGIPRPRCSYYGSRSCLVTGEALKKLPLVQQGEVRKMESLCDQFISATIIILAAPMWSLSFPGIVKDYLDCVILKDKTITFHKEKPQGLLGDRERTFFYVQSSGGNIPWALRPVLNKGLGYVEDIMKFVGIEHVDELLVDDTGTTEHEFRKATEEAIGKIDDLLEQRQLDEVSKLTLW